MPQPSRSTITQRIAFPKDLTFAAGSRLVTEIDHLPARGTCVLDLTAMGWVEPFAMLHVVSAVARKIDRCPELALKASGLGRNGYARFMGFDRELGAPDQLDAEPPPNHENYLPIQRLDLSRLRADASARDQALGAIIDEHTGSIAHTLARQRHGPLWGTLQYALREIIRNAAEHSGSDLVLYCGQYWPTKHRVEVAILDEGIGIAPSLARNPLVRLDGEAHALRLCLEPGVSGVAYEGAAIDGENEWSNSGFGLYVVSELCRRGGSMTIVSGGTGLCVASEGVQSVRASHAGTALRLIIDTSNLRSIAASLALIVAEGEKRAREQRRGQTSASAASKRGSAV